LHLAARNGNLDVALVERGADLNTRNGMRETPLELASNNWKLDIVGLLILRSGNVTSQNDVGQAHTEKWAQPTMRETAAHRPIELRRDSCLVFLDVACNLIHLFLLAILCGRLSALGLGRLHVNPLLEGNKLTQHFSR
jgi:hypothetical protein